MYLKDLSSVGWVGEMKASLQSQSWCLMAPGAINLIRDI